MYNSHPAWIHYPVALIPVSFFLYATALFITTDWLSGAARTNLYFGFIFAVISVVTGLRAEHTFPMTGAVSHVLETHETVGIAILCVTSILAVWSFIRKNGWPKKFRLFLILLGFNTYLVLQNADLGGRMVYELGAAVKPAVEKFQSEGKTHVAADRNGTVSASKKNAAKTPET